MIPPEYSLRIYAGDSFGDGWAITVPDLTSRGGPANIAAATVTAQIRAKQDPSSEVLADFEVLKLDASRVRPRLTPAQTAALVKKGYWDLQVESNGWVGTVLRGAVEVVKDVTR